MPSSSTSQYMFNNICFRMHVTYSLLLSHLTQHKMMYPSGTNLPWQKRFLREVINYIRHVIVLIMEQYLSNNRKWTKTHDIKVILDLLKLRNKQFEMCKLFCRHTVPNLVVRAKEGEHQFSGDFTGQLFVDLGVRHGAPISAVPGRGSDIQGVISPSFWARGIKTLGWASEGGFTICILFQMLFSWGSLKKGCKVLPSGQRLRYRDNNEQIKMIKWQLFLKTFQFLLFTHFFLISGRW